MSNVEHRSTQLRERIPLREDEGGLYCIIDGRNQKVILAIQLYQPEPGEDIGRHFAFCEEIGAASTLLSDKDLKKQYKTLKKAYELAIERISAFAQYIIQVYE